MSAVCFAFPLRHAHPWLAAGIVLLTAFGRIYFRAHHFFDVLGGAALAYSICAGVVASGMYGSWWHPVLAQAAFLLYAKAVGELGGDPLQTYDGEAEEEEEEDGAAEPVDLDRELDPAVQAEVNVYAATNLGMS
jgi:hypothetical protein